MVAEQCVYDLVSGVKIPPNHYMQIYMQVQTKIFATLVLIYVVNLHSHDVDLENSHLK